MRILIVDDDESNLDVLRSLLVREGYTVETATNGKAALAILRRGTCRLIISDWEMPAMNGLDLCRAVRAEDVSPSGYIYFILLTSHDTPSDTVKGLSAGADDFIRKPFFPPELTVRVRAGERVLALETRDVALFALAKLAESRDPETGTHLERVRGYCRLIAQRLLGAEAFQGQVDAEYVRLIYLTSPLHDIGKVGIPDTVLLKPGRLSDREFEIMKTHAAVGAQTLDAALARFPAARFLQMARDIAACHHEQYDGTGYPHQLAADEIPLSGRIVALADVYDALTSRRVYKTAFAHEVAKALILNAVGSHFDPIVAQAFIDGEADFLAIRDQFPENAKAA